MTSSVDMMPGFDRMQLQAPFDLTYYNEQPLSGGQFHSHAFYEIYYFHEGRCTYLIGDSVFTLKPGICS